ncbi:hypothetical protein TNCT_416421 [Trichonephila clavata]|uniref:Uncharacterized protein n=1 Tax=Trichonephila clavata TaxID=2740835 RepID=A0A8X6F7W6_TRICU|nr:hypothetical protein TNCT_416421 [Trichonephila clavata]
MIKVNRHITTMEQRKDLESDMSELTRSSATFLNTGTCQGDSVPTQLTPTLMEQCLGFRMEHFVRCHNDGNDLLFWIVMGDDSWNHHLTQEVKAPLCM